MPTGVWQRGSFRLKYQTATSLASISKLRKWP
jgi:hypothetical protein